MVYDASRQRVLLFGGDNNATSFGDTWEWDGTTWAQRTPTVSPPALVEPMMAFDAARGRAILFGGAYSNGQESFETWEWDGSTWTRLTPNRNPPPRSNGVLAYDAARQRAVLFGGRRAWFNGVNVYPPVYYDDTWEWDGSDWSRRAPSTVPVGRNASAMAYDAARGVAVLYAGGALRTGPMLDDTWEWNGIDWQFRGNGGAAPNTGVLAYDAARQRVVLPIGEHGTYLWDGTKWSLRLSSTVPALLGRMTYDRARSRVVMHGVDTTWEWDGMDWQARTPVGGAPGVPDVQAPGLAYDEARQQTVLFGGSQGLTTFDDTWLWDGSTWTGANPAVRPPPRLSPAMAYDRARGRILLFGGDDNTTSLGDTWEWDGTSWTQLFPASAPSARRAQMVYDSARQRIVLFGGQDIYHSKGYFDSWEWDGTNWIERVPTANPPPPNCTLSIGPYTCIVRDAFLAYDKARGQTVVTWEFRTWVYGPEYPAAQESYGTGCAGSAGTPVLAPQAGPPWAGEPFAMEVRNVPDGSSGLAVIGLSSSVWQGVSLPMSLSFLSVQPTCQLLTGIVVSLPWTALGTTASWTVPVPNQPAALGISFYQQALVLDAGAPGGMTVSNGGASRIGGK